MPSRGLLPGRLTFLSGGREAVGGRISPRLSPAQPAALPQLNTLWATFGQDFPSSLRPSLHCLLTPALWQRPFLFGTCVLVVIFGNKKNLRGSYPVYHILGRSWLTKPAQRRFIIPMNSDPISFLWTQIMQPKVRNASWAAKVAGWPRLSSWWGNLIPSLQVSLRHVQEFTSGDMSSFRTSRLFRMW